MGNVLRSISNKSVLAWCAFVTSFALGEHRAFAADPQELQPNVSDLSGARSMGMGDAFRAVGTSNEAIYLNPASLEAQPRYEYELFGHYDQGRPDIDFGGSIADSSAGPIALGLSYIRWIEGDPDQRVTASIYHVALAADLGPNISLGVTGKWLHYSDNKVHNVVTPDLGLLLKFDLVNVAAVAYNIVDVHSPQAPRQVALGASIGSETSFKGTIDVVGDFDSRPDFSLAFHGGLEYLVVSVLTLRVGYTEDRIRMDRFVSGGISLFIPPGIGLDLAYRQQIGGVETSRMIALTLKLQPHFEEWLGTSDQ
jgi:hypothetical protein